MRKSVGKPKEKFTAYAKVYKLVDGKYVPESDSTTLLKRTHHTEGIGLNEFKSSCIKEKVDEGAKKVGTGKRNQNPKQSLSS